VRPPPPPIPTNKPGMVVHTHPSYVRGTGRGPAQAKGETLSKKQSKAKSAEGMI
jgi:hypothetical protein